MTLESEEKILLILTDIKFLIKYQAQLLEAMATNSDEMLNRKNNFNPEKQIEEIQKIIPNGIDLKKIFSMVQKKE